MRPRTILLALTALLIAMTLAAYLPAYDAGFVDYDDPDYVRDNEHVLTGLTWENVSWAFTQQHAANWHPLTWISHMIDVEMFGPKAQGHHLVNVLLHAVNVVLLFSMLRSITGETIASFIVAALFAVHPVNVESVAWISQRKTTLSTLFAILAIWTYARYAQSASRRSYWASLGLFACSLMCKQTWVTMPAVLLLLDYWPLRRAALEPPRGKPPTLGSLARGWWHLLGEKLPYLALVVAASSVTLVVQQQAMKSVESHPLLPRLGNAIIAYTGYLVELVWPVHLAVFYPFYAEDVTALRALPALALLLTITAACCWFGLRWRYLLVGWLWFLGTLVPMIGLVQVGDQSMADRYAYTTFWGLFIALVWGTQDVVRALGKTTATRLAAGSVTAAIISACGVLTYRQAEHWHDSIALFTDAVKDTDRNGLALNNLAWLLATTTDPNRHDPVEAVRLAEEACRVSRRENLVCLDTLATAYAAAGRLDDAISVCREGVEKSNATGNAAAAAMFRKSLQSYEARNADDASPTGQRTAKPTATRP